MMPKITIMMSTFNETELELKLAINSILNQNFNDFEYIVVNDNPLRKDLSRILSEFEKEDSRFRVITNNKNIGLAMSLNKAAKLNSSKFLMRMDADDISLPGRINNQYEIINTGKYDCVFSNFELIDKNGITIQNQVYNRYYNSMDIQRLLPYDNIIHHPTVLMTREIFE